MIVNLYVDGFLKCFTGHNVLVKQKQRCGKQRTAAFKTSNESHLYWKKYFQYFPLFIRVYADFETDNKVDIYSVGNKTTDNYKQNRVCNGYYIVSVLHDVLESGYYESPLGYDIVDWFGNEITKKKIKFFLQNFYKVFLKSEEYEEHYRYKTFSHFCENKIVIIGLQIIVS